jgi:quinol monooxygenase YgiN
MIHVIAQIEVHPGRRRELLDELARIVPEVRAERGAIEYGAAVDLATPVSRQAPPRPDVVTILEKWSDVAALEAHLAAPHMQAYRERVRDLVKSAQLYVLEPAS